jgi:hypothetical protein
MLKYDYIGKKVDGYIIHQYKPEEDIYIVSPESGGALHVMTSEYVRDRYREDKKIGTVHPSEEAAKEYYAGYGITPNRTNTWTVNAGDSVNSYFDTTTGLKFSDPQAAAKAKPEWVNSVNDLLNTQTLAYQAPKTSTPLKMTRLTTYENWTILLRDNKLVAVNEKGETIEAIGSLLSAGGKAWMWKGGQLWRGTLERTLTEKEEQFNEESRKREAVLKKYNSKIHALKDKTDALYEKRDEELRSI